MGRAAEDIPHFADGSGVPSGTRFREPDFSRQWKWRATVSSPSGTFSERSFEAGLRCADSREGGGPAFRL